MVTVTYTCEGVTKHCNAHTQNSADEPGEIRIVTCSHISFHGFDGETLYGEAWNHGGGWVKRREPPYSGGV